MEDIQRKLIDLPKDVLEYINTSTANTKGKAKGYIEDLVISEVRKQKEKKGVNAADG